MHDDSVPDNDSFDPCSGVSLCLLSLKSTSPVRFLLRAKNRLAMMYTELSHKVVAPWNS